MSHYALDYNSGFEIAAHGPYILIMCMQTKVASLATSHLQRLYRPLDCIMHLMMAGISTEINVINTDEIATN